MSGSDSACPVGNLPAELTSFVGRRAEIATVQRLLGEHRLVTLTGAAGVGKTRLALRVAAQAAGSFADGVWLVELAGLEDEKLLPQRVADILLGSSQPLHAPTGYSRDLREVLAEFVPDKELLLVLDNCEHIADACAELVDDLRRAAAGVRVLATSRQVLHVDEEWVFDVPPLPAPDRHGPLQADVAGNDSVRLFAERAATALPGFTVNADNQHTVVGLCRHLGGIPLAIELAAVHVRTMPCERILAQLEDRYLEVLNEAARVSVPRLQTLQAAIDWSFGRCSQQEQRLWARASVFHGGFDLEAAEQVCSDDDIHRGDVLGLVTGLANKSVLIRSLVGDTGRYQMPETLREYGRQKFRELGEGATVRMRHRDHFAELARRSQQAFLTPEELQAYTAVRLDQDNLRAGLEYCLTEPGEAGAALEMGASLAYWWMNTGCHREGRSWLERALVLDTRPNAARAKALYITAWLALRQGDHDAASSLIDRSRALAQRLGDVPALARATHVAGVEALLCGDLRRALTLLEHALTELRTLNDRNGVFLALEHLIWTTALLGEADRAGSLGEEYVRMANVSGAPVTGPWSIAVHGIAQWLVGNQQRASELVRLSLATAPASAGAWQMAHSLELLAWDAAARHDLERAARLFGSAHTVWRYMATPLSKIRTVATQHARWEQRTRGALGERRFDKIFDDGATLSPDQAIANALASHT